MHDIELSLENRPGALAAAGEALGRAGINIDGGGAWVINGRGSAHFLVSHGEAARAALEAEGIEVVRVREVLVQRLDREMAGQLGAFTRRMAEAGINIEVLYHDHANQLVLAVDDLEKGRHLSNAWSVEAAWSARENPPKPDHRPPT